MLEVNTLQSNNALQKKRKNSSMTILEGKSNLPYRIPFEDGTSVSLSSF
jgi:hypothetical protein